MSNCSSNAPYDRNDPKTWPVRSVDLTALPPCSKVDMLVPARSLDGVVINGQEHTANLFIKLGRPPEGVEGFSDPNTFVLLAEVWGSDTPEQMGNIGALLYLKPDTTGAKEWLVLFKSIDAGLADQLAPAQLLGLAIDVADGVNRTIATVEPAILTVAFDPTYADLQALDRAVLALPEAAARHPGQGMMESCYVLAPEVLACRAAGDGIELTPADTLH